MSPVELPVIAPPASASDPPSRSPQRDQRWRRAARRARALSWASLGWMTIEGVVGLIAGLNADALSVVGWAASSFCVIVIGSTAAALADSSVPRFPYLSIHH